MIIELIIILVLFLILKWIYFNNLLVFLDLIASVSNLLNYYFVKYRYQVVEYNLNRVFPNISKNKFNEIYYYSTKLFILNSLIAIHQRFIIDTNYLTKYYNKVDIPDELKEDLKNNKVIFAMAHYGIYYDFSTFVNLYKFRLACAYKMKNNIIEKLIYKSDLYKNRVLPLRHNILGSLIDNNYDIITIPTDQKANQKKEKIMFLNQETNFHYSVADIHKATKRSIWIFFSYYDFRNQKMNIELIPITNLNKKREITQQIADLITERALKYPEQYFWHHDRFNSGLK